MLEAKESLRSPGQYGRPTTRSPDDGKTRTIYLNGSSTAWCTRKIVSKIPSLQHYADHDERRAPVQRLNLLATTAPPGLWPSSFYFFAPTTTVKHDSVKNPPPQPPQPRQNNPPEAHSVFSWGEKSRVGLGGKTNSCSKQTALVSKKYKKLDTKNLSNF
jgi:hypothetical protein